MLTLSTPPLYILTTVWIAIFHIWLHHSIRPVDQTTDFQFCSCVIWYTSVFSPCFTSFRMTSQQPPFHWDHFPLLFFSSIICIHKEFCPINQYENCFRQALVCSISQLDSTVARGITWGNDHNTFSISVLFLVCAAGWIKAGQLKLWYLRQSKIILPLRSRYLANTSRKH